MSKTSKFIILILVSFILATLITVLLVGNSIPVLHPKGEIASKERDLMIFGSLLSLIVVLPVFIMTFFIVWKYRESNKSAKYTPNWDSNKIIETIWWGVPITLITILSVVTWKSSHDLDPFRPIQADAKPLTVQVVALDWKWLFIYPEQNIATVNYVQFPVDQPVKFEITSDAPMNSFWIPALGGQMYAMSGMSTELNLIANEVGNYNGSSANISGRGFAGMRFIARASGQTEFNQWIDAVKLSSKKLTLDEYSKLATPSENYPKTYFAASTPELYKKILDQYGHNHSGEPRT